ncbi:unnamed protein product [Closterium sp. Naga37s-1]|nr:unnamed protein product [Closterium sp. Naga37s-1]
MLFLSSRAKSSNSRLNRAFATIAAHSSLSRSPFTTTLLITLSVSPPIPSPSSSHVLWPSLSISLLSSLGSHFLLSSRPSHFLGSPPVALNFSALLPSLSPSPLLPSLSLPLLTSRRTHVLRSPPVPLIFSALLPPISLLVKSPSSFPVPSSHPCPFPSHPSPPASFPSHSVAFVLSLPVPSLSSFPFRTVAFFFSLPVSSYRLSGVLRSPPIALDFSAPLPLPSLSPLPSHCLPSPRISPSLTRRSLPVALSHVALSSSLSVTLPSLPVASQFSSSPPSHSSRLPSETPSRRPPRVFPRFPSPPRSPVPSRRPRAFPPAPALSHSPIPWLPVALVIFLPVAFALALKRPITPCLSPSHHPPRRPRPRHEMPSHLLFISHLPSSRPPHVIRRPVAYMSPA